MHPPAAPLARHHVSEFEDWLAEGGEGLPPKFEASDVEAAFVKLHGGAGLSGVHGVGPRARIHARPRHRALTESDDHNSIVSSRLIAIF